MDSNIPTLEQTDLDKLNEKDKAELRQFIANEQQRTRIQSRMCQFLLAIFAEGECGANIDCQRHTLSRTFVGRSA
jgi:hypothetical protein